MLDDNSLISYEPLSYEDYQYPTWANIFGMLLAASSILCIPIVAAWKLATATGTLPQRIRYLLTPYRDSHWEPSKPSLLNTDGPTSL